MSNKNIGFIVAGLLIVYGLFEILSFNQREIVIGIAFVFYGVGSMLTATQHHALVRIGVGVNFITLACAAAAGVYERFG